MLARDSIFKKLWIDPKSYFYHTTIRPRSQRFPADFLRNHQCTQIRTPWLPCWKERETLLFQIALVNQKQFRKWPVFLELFCIYSPEKLCYAVCRR